MHLILILAVVFLVNLPFGYWRDSLRKFSPLWFLAVHGAIPLIVLFRLILVVPWQLGTFPLFLLAYFAGQFLGARVHRRIAALD